MDKKQMREMNIIVTNDISSKKENVVINEFANLIDQVSVYVFEVCADPDKVVVAIFTIVSNFLKRLLPLNTDEDNEKLMKKAFTLINYRLRSEVEFSKVQA